MNTHYISPTARQILLEPTDMIAASNYTEVEGFEKNVSENTPGYGDDLTRQQSIWDYWKDDI